MKHYYHIIYLLSIFLVLLNSCTIDSDIKSNHFEIDISNHDEGYIRVVFYPKPLKSDSAIYSLIYSDSLYSYGSHIKELKVFNSNNENLDTINGVWGDIIIPQARNIDRIEYIIEDIWTSDKPGYLPASTNINSKRILLSLHNFLGYFEEQKDEPYTVNIIDKSKALNSIYLKNEAKIKTDSSYLLNFRNHNELLMSSFMFTKNKATEVIINNSHIFISISRTTNNTITDNIIINSIKPIIETDFKHYIIDVDTIYLNLIFFPTDYEEGIGFKNTSNLIIPEVYESKTNIEALQDLLAHELLHFISPINLHSNIIDNNLFLKKKMSSTLWFNEGGIEYLSMISLLESGLYDTLDFNNKLGRHINTFEYYNWKKTRKPFIWYSKNRVNQDNEMSSSIFVRKGALVCYCIDMLLKTEGAGMTFKILTDSLYYRFKDNPYSDNDFYLAINSITNNEVSAFVNSYILDTLELDIDHYLDLGNLTNTGQKVKDTFKYYSFFNVYNGIDYRHDSLFIINSSGLYVYVDNIDGNNVGRLNVYDYLNFPIKKDTLIINKGLDTEDCLLIKEFTRQIYRKKIISNGKRKIIKYRKRIYT